MAILVAGNNAKNPPRQRQHVVSNPLSNPNKRSILDDLPTPVLYIGGLIAFSIIIAILYALSSIFGSSAVDNQELKKGTSGTVVVKTKYGSVRIVLRPDLSPESTDYVAKVAIESEQNGCAGCSFYRAEEPGIVQGVMAAPPSSNLQVNTEFGKCPEGYGNVPQNCPDFDPNCGCHGPIMTKGMVAWAGGTSGGPDFFMNVYKKPAFWWGNQHTIWGHIKDDMSLSIVMEVFSLPTGAKEQDMTMLAEEIPFTMKFIPSS